MQIERNNRLISRALGSSIVSAYHPTQLKGRLHQALIVSDAYSYSMYCAVLAAVFCP